MKSENEDWTKLEWPELHELFASHLANYRMARRLLVEGQRSMKDRDETIQKVIRDLVRRGYAEDAYACNLLYERARGCVPTPGTSSMEFFMARVLGEIVQEDRERRDDQRADS
jgi:hypothetical protein